MLSVLLAWSESAKTSQVGTAWQWRKVSLRDHCHVVARCQVYWSCKWQRQESDSSSSQRRNRCEHLRLGRTECLRFSCLFRILGNCQSFAKVDEGRLQEHSWQGWFKFVDGSCVMGLTKVATRKPNCSKRRINARICLNCFAFSFSCHILPKWWKRSSFNESAAIASHSFIIMWKCEVYPTTCQIYNGKTSFYNTHVTKL